MGDLRCSEALELAAFELKLGHSLSQIPRIMGILEDEKVILVSVDEGNKPTFNSNLIGKSIYKQRDGIITCHQ